MSLYANITGVVGIIIVLCLFLLGVAQLLWLMLQRWDSWRAVSAILTSFLAAYVAISYMVTVMREYVPLPQLFWE